jgi:hypothetical protein
MPFGRNHYINALENRVAELESLLAKQGTVDFGQDHWQYLQQSGPSKDAGRARPSKSSIDVSDMQISTILVSDELSSSDEQGYKENSEQDRAESLVGVLRDLSLDANGGYIGASSSITMGRMVGLLVKNMENNKASSPKALQGQKNLSPKSGYNRDSTTIDFDNMEPMLATAEAADRLLNGYLKHVATRWPVLHSAHIRRLHTDRNTVADIYERSILHLVYAIGGRFLETTGETGNFFPEEHYDAALENLDEILKYHDLRTVVMIVLLGIYCLRAPRGPGAW